MLYADQYNTFENSLTNAKNVVSLEWLYDGLRKALGKAMLVLLLVVVGFPLVLLFGFLLKRKRKKFQKEMRKSLEVFRSSGHYLRFKMYLKELQTLKPDLKKVANYNVKKAPWPLKYTLVQMQKMSSTLLTYADWSRKHLDCMNTEQFKGEPKVFTFLSEKELWRKRNKRYQYWM